MKGFLKLLIPLSSLSALSLYGIMWVHSDTISDTPVCAVPNNSDAVVQDTHINERIYYVGCGGLF